MVKVDETVKKETVYIALFTLIPNMLLEAVFLIIGKWDLTVLAGNLLGYAVGVANFFLLGLTVQTAIKKEEKEVKNIMKLSQSLRYIMVIAVAALGASLPVFNIWATLLPLLFPRIAITARPLFDKKEVDENNEN